MVLQTVRKQVVGVEEDRGSVHDTRVMLSVSEVMDKAGPQQCVYK